MKTNLNLKPIAALVTLLFVLITFVVSAQTKTITGVVRDADQQSLEGVSVSVKGTSQGVLTGSDGRFSITVDPDKQDVLVFSFLGKKTAEVSIADKDYLEVTLAELPTQLIELVVLGAAGDDQLYTETKRDKRAARKAKRER